MAQLTDPSPIPGCALDQAGLTGQLGRYRDLAMHATSVERRTGEIVVVFGADLPAGLLECTLDIERRCCPFVHTTYDREQRRLLITVENIDQAPRLEGLHHALSRGHEFPHTQGGRGMAALTNECCTTETQAVCCEPAAKAECCDASHGNGCGCSAGATTHEQNVRETVRQRYAQAARAAAEGTTCCGDLATADRSGNEVFGAALYSDEADGAPKAAVQASLGCGVPTAVADLHDGEVVLDLGSGAGADVLISARRVAPTGKAIGLDMTDEMLDLARGNAAEAGIENVEFIKGYIEEIPLPDASVDVVISNCVINLSGDKAKVLSEVGRVLRPGGRFAVSDVVADPDMDEATRADMAQWTGCIAGALTRDEYERHLRGAGLQDIEFAETHRVHEHAASAIIRASRPSR